MAAALDVKILDRHRDRRTDAGEGVDHQGNQGAIAQAHDMGGRDGVQQVAGFLSREQPRFSFLDDQLGPADRRGWIDTAQLGNLPGNNQPVVEHANGGQLLLDRGLGLRQQPLLDVGGNVIGLSTGTRN